MKNPYRTGADHRFWRRVVADRAPGEIDPMVGRPMVIGREERIVTAGSCFAQHIGRYLKQAGYNFAITEPGHPALSPMMQLELNYGVYTARYGNIYTSRQLLQLLERAYGRFEPVEDVWQGEDGALYDPFRPEIQPGGFPTAQIYRSERERHLSAVRRAFEDCDVFIFTLGLTEAWLSKADGAAFPVCPGVGAGDYDPNRHAFHNLTAEDVVNDMTAFIAGLRSVNPGVRVILTVSPVPLMATAEEDHVLAATAYSKAVLRVAAETLRRSLPQVYYFPSYEIVTGPQTRGAYFAPDHRTILEAGVRQVMSSFFRHFTEHEPDWDAAPQPGAGRTADQGEEVAQAICDEDLLDPAD